MRNRHLNGTPQVWYCSSWVILFSVFLSTHCYIDRFMQTRERHLFHLPHLIPQQPYSAFRDALVTSNLSMGKIFPLSEMREFSAPQWDTSIQVRTFSDFCPDTTTNFSESPVKNPASAFRMQQVSNSIIWLYEFQFTSLTEKVRVQGKRRSHRNLQTKHKPISNRDQFSWWWICTPK